MTILSGPFDLVDDDNNDDVLYVGDTDDLPDIWSDSTTILDSWED